MVLQQIPVKPNNQTKKFNFEKFTAFFNSADTFVRTRCIIHNGAEIRAAEPRRKVLIQSKSSAGSHTLALKYLGIKRPKTTLTRKPFRVPWWD